MYKSPVCIKEYPTECVQAVPVYSAMMCLAPGPGLLVSPGPGSQAQDATDLVLHDQYYARVYS